MLATLIAIVACPCFAEQPLDNTDRLVRDKYGAIVRGDVETKKLAIVFTGDKRGESTQEILDILKSRRIHAGFFVTGNFVRDPQFHPLLTRAIKESHYVGPHSDSHPLYCDWDNRDESLVTRAFFIDDLHKNMNGLRKLGALNKDQPPLFIPPHEWFNGDQVKWSRDAGVTLFNFTPGSGSNRDYVPEDNRAFVPSQKIYDDILAYEQCDPHGLNGFILLLHLGSGRKDPFHTKLPALCDELKARGYEFVRIDELLQPQHGN